jgi:2-(1,2-epoxy-1,2-dihydrophenyl)acetyl-CoA isomerase
VAYGAIRRALSYSATHELTDALSLEAELMRLTGATADHRGAVSAFLAKERPTFRGR